MQEKVTFFLQNITFSHFTTLIMSANAFSGQSIAVPHA